MHKTTMATTISRMITMIMTMLLPVAAVFLLLVRCSHYKSLALCGLSKQNIKNGRKTKQTKTTIATVFTTLPQTSP